MKRRSIRCVMAMGCLVTVLLVGRHAHQLFPIGWGRAFLIEGIVLKEDGARSFEQVGSQDRRMLLELGFPKAVHQLHAVVRHLVIHLDCHYFFTTDGRVLVMTLSTDGRTPRLLETKHWQGDPHDFRDYRTELLPSP